MKPLIKYESCKTRHAALTQLTVPAEILDPLVENCHNLLNTRRIPEDCNNVLQRSVLRPLLLIIYINDLDGNGGGLIGEFADITNISRVVNCEEDCQRMQHGIEQLQI